MCLRQRKLSAEDVAFCMELLGEGVKLGYIAHYVFGVGRADLYSRLRTWGVFDGG